MIFVISLERVLDIFLRNFFTQFLHGELDVSCTNLSVVVCVELLEDCIQFLLASMTLEETFCMHCCCNELTIVYLMSACRVDSFDDLFCLFLS